MSELDIAVLAFKKAYYRPGAVERRQERKDGYKNAWKALKDRPSRLKKPVQR